eukprot:185386-Chlamydomonas_euryale.AAC.1
MAGSRTSSGGSRKRRAASAAGKKAWAAAHAGDGGMGAAGVADGGAAAELASLAWLERIDADQQSNARGGPGVACGASGVSGGVGEYEVRVAVASPSVPPQHAFSALRPLMSDAAAPKIIHDARS